MPNHRRKRLRDRTSHNPTSSGFCRCGWRQTRTGRTGRIGWQRNLEKKVALASVRLHARTERIVVPWSRPRRNHRAECTHKHGCTRHGAVMAAHIQARVRACVFKHELWSTTLSGKCRPNIGNLSSAYGAADNREHSTNYGIHMPNISDKP